MLGIRDALIQDAESYVQSIAGRLRVAGFNAASEVRSTGDARLAILDAAAAWPADLIVLGSHGRSGLDRFLLGSVSEGVVRHATCSVQVVRRPRAAASRPSERAS
jgi:nucleotide-binding universal stress UspA family protein